MTADAFGELAAAYRDRSGVVARAKAAGRRVVGYLGPSVPVELIDAAGAVPVALAADTATEFPNADPHVDAELEQETRSIVEQALRGDLAGFDQLVVTPSSEAHNYAYRFLKELRRTGADALIPPIHVVDVMQARKPWIEAYVRRQVGRFARRLEVDGGVVLSGDALAQAITTRNEIRRLRGQIARHRLDRRLLGRDALVAIGAGRFVEPERYAELLGELERTLVERDPIDRPRVAVVSSTPLFHPDLHELIEQAGLLVVAEDDWWGSAGDGFGDGLHLVDPAGAADAAGLVDALADHYYRWSPTSQVRYDVRYGLTVAMAERHEVDAVVFVISPKDGYFGWEYPDLRALIDAAGVPSVVVRADPLTDDGRDAIGRVLHELDGLLELDSTTTEVAL